MFDSLELERLRRIGLSPRFGTHLAALPPPQPGSALWRVTEVHRETLLLHDGQAEQPARMLPALRAQLAAADDALAVGDWVWTATHLPGGIQGATWVHTRVSPLNQIARRLHDGRDKLSRMVIVSNVDVAVLVMGLDHDFSLRRLERYLSLVRMAGVAAVLVLTKKDLCLDTELRLQEARAVAGDGAPVLAVNALTEEPQTALAPWLQPGQTLVLLGSSGAGKSSLTNALCGAGVADTGSNRSSDSRGRHTTTARTLYFTQGQACLIDTPGLRSLRLDGDAGGVEATFDDIAQRALHCRFRDCTHADEPGCAVRGHVSDERLKNWRKLLREAQRDSLTVLQRKAQVARWKACGRQARLRADLKRG